MSAALPSPLLILIVAQKKEFCEHLGLLINQLKENSELHITQCLSLDHAIKALHSRSFHLILTSLQLKDSSGLSTFKEMSKYSGFSAFIIIEDHLEEAFILELMNLGAQDYLPKENLNEKELIFAIKTSLQRQQHHERIKALSFTDSLTGLYNHRGFHAFLEQHIALSKRLKKGFYLFFIDFDGLKKINDLFGHPAGDLALIESAQCLKVFTRLQDVAARIGGDEFAVIALHAKKEDGPALKQRLIESIKERNALLKEPFQLHLSIGMAYFDGTLSQEDLIQLADRSLYEAKQKSDKGDKV